MENIKYICSDGIVELDKEKSKIYFKIVDDLIRDTGDTPEIRMDIFSVDELRNLIRYNDDIYNMEKYSTTKYIFDNKNILNFMGSYDVENYGVAEKIIEAEDMRRLKWLYEKNKIWSGDECSLSAKYGKLECLKYAYENGCNWDSNTCTYAAGGGYLDILKYAHENGCGWDAEVYLCAIWNGHFECLKYMYENKCEPKCEPKGEYPERLYEYMTYMCITIRIERPYEYKTEYDFIHQNYCYNDISGQCVCACVCAAKGGNVECLKYLRDNCFSWGEIVCAYASGSGNLDASKKRLRVSSGVAVVAATV